MNLTNVHSSPFGMQIANRTWEALENGYRFGFNGKERDDEVSGSGNSIAFEARIYDSRLGRFFSVDPWSYKYPWQSSYVFAFNNPIANIDYLGLGDPDDESVSSSENKNDNTTHTIENETLWGVLKQNWDANNGVDGYNTWDEYWSDMWDYNGGKDHYENGEVVYLTKPTPKSSSNSQGYSFMNYDVYVPYEVGDVTSSYFGSEPQSLTEEEQETMQKYENTMYLLIFSTTVSTAESLVYNEALGVWFGKNGKMYDFRFNGNGTTGGRNKFARTTRNGVRAGGFALGIVNEAFLYDQYTNGEINSIQFGAETGSNVISTFGGLYGVSWGIGWELGRELTETRGYQNWKYDTVYPFLNSVLGESDPD